MRVGSVPARSEAFGSTPKRSERHRFSRQLSGPPRRRVVGARADKVEGSAAVAARALERLRRRCVVARRGPVDRRHDVADAYVSACAARALGHLGHHHACAIRAIGEGEAARRTHAHLLARLGRVRAGDGLVPWRLPVRRRRRRAAREARKLEVADDGRDGCAARRARRLTLVDPLDEAVLAKVVSAAAANGGIGHARAADAAVGHGGGRKCSQAERRRVERDSRRAGRVLRARRLRSRRGGSRCVRRSFAARWALTMLPRQFFPQLPREFTQLERYHGGGARLADLGGI